ncbi:helix-turn-helix domain-containing protein [Salmonella enterica]
MKNEYIFKRIIHWIEENIGENISVKDVVNKSGYSTRSVHYLFNGYLGCGIYAYIKNRRLSLAAKLLKMTNVPIIEICSIYHFCSYQSFNRAFSIKFGASPARYRRTTNWLLKEYTGNAALERPEIISQPINLPQLKVMVNTSVFRGDFLSALYGNQIIGCSTLEIKEYIRTLVLKNMDRENIMIAYRFKPGYHLNSLLKVSSSVLDKKGDNAPIQGQMIDGGLYYQFHYEGTWEGYERLSDYIYWCELPRLKINKRKSMDLEFFDINKMEKTNKFVVDFYVPVTSSTIVALE